MPKNEERPGEEVPENVRPPVPEPFEYKEREECCSDETKNN